MGKTKSRQRSNPMAERLSRTFPCILGLTLSAGLANSQMAVAQTTTPSIQNHEIGASPRDIITTGDIGVSLRRLRPGQTVYITLNLTKTGSGTAYSQGPSPRTVYIQGENYTQKGLTVIQPNRYSVVMTLSGPRGEEWPYRWGIGGDLKLGQDRSVTFPLRMTQPGLYTLYIGIAAGGQVRELALGQIGLEVALPGEKFQTQVGRRIGTPPPTNVTINGKVVAMDQWPQFYEAPLSQMTENPEIMVPIRFVTEEMGAQVDWDAATRTTNVWRNGNHVALRANSTHHLVNGKPVDSRVPLRVVDGRTMVPVNFMIEKFGGTVQWNLRTRTLAIQLPAAKNRAVPVGAP